MAKVVLSTLNAKFIHSSLALRYLRASIREEHQVSLLEFTIHDPIDQIIAAFFEAEPDVIGLSCYIWNIEQIGKIIPLIKKVMPDVFLILGGPEVSYAATYYMDKFPEVDVVAVGEGDELFKELMSALHQGQSVGSVQGLYYRAFEKVLFTGSRTYANLAALPSPYAEDEVFELRHRIVYYEASRGCPFTCQFCLSSLDESVRYFPLERVLSELDRLIRQNIRQINFVDRTFNLRKDYALAIFSFLAQSPGDTQFHFEITGDILRPDLIDWLVENAPKGRFRFEVGVQSTNEVTNSAVQRRQNFDKLSTTVRRIRESGKIHQHLDLIAGLPFEDYGSFRKTFNDVYSLKPDELQLGFLKLLWGTNLRNDAQKYGFVAMDIPPYEVLSSDVLSYRDHLRLKRLEDILEKYYNSGRFTLVLSYLTEKCFDTPFDFYQSFGDYWHELGWNRIGHQPLDLVLRLREFLQSAGVWDEIIYALLRTDYLLREKQKPRHLFWREHKHHDNDVLSLFEMEHDIWERVPNLLEDSKRRDFLKRVVLDRIPREVYDRLHLVMNSLSDGQGEWKDGILLFIYPTGTGKPTLYGWPS